MISCLTGDETAHTQLLKQFKAKKHVPWTLFRELLREMSTDPYMQERKHVSIPLTTQRGSAGVFVHITRTRRGTVRVVRQ